MTLTKLGRRMLRRFRLKYGKRGEEVFYSYMRKYPYRTRKWERKGWQPGKSAEEIVGES